MGFPGQRDGAPRSWGSHPGVVRQYRRDPRVAGCLCYSDAAQPYEAAFASRLVGRHVSGTPPFSGAEPVLRGLHPLRSVSLMVFPVRAGGSGAGCRGAAQWHRALVHARGFSPTDCLSICRRATPCLPPRGDRAFPPTRDSVIVSLAIPQHKPADPISRRRKRRMPVRRDTRIQHDENNGTDDRPVRIARKNLRLLIDTEPVSGCLIMPIARVKRDGSGHFVYDPSSCRRFSR